MTGQNLERMMVEIRLKMRSDDAKWANGKITLTDREKLMGIFSLFCLCTAGLTDLEMES